MFGWDGHTVSGGRLEMPALDGRDHLLVNAVANAVEQLLFHHVAFRIDRDLNHYLTMHSTGQLPAGYSGFAEGNGKAGFDFIPIGFTIES